jgi:hypothetical protein
MQLHPSAFGPPPDGVQGDGRPEGSWTVTNSLTSASPGLTSTLGFLRSYASRTGAEISGNTLVVPTDNARSKNFAEWLAVGHSGSGDSTRPPDRVELGWSPRTVQSTVPVPEVM